LLWALSLAQTLRYELQEHCPKEGRMMDRRILVPPGKSDRAEDIRPFLEYNLDSSTIGTGSNVALRTHRPATDPSLPDVKLRDEYAQSQSWPAWFRAHLQSLIGPTVCPEAYCASSVQRKLAAILMADVKGYSRLMGTDEEETVHRLREYQELVRRRIEEYRGRLVETPGDALLAEFGSVVDAVRCAVEAQNELRVRNAELPTDHRMDFRMGINLGDLIVDGDSLYGDGVNIAARLEPLAEAGGICISGSVHDNVKNKLQLACEYLGEKTLKNIEVPVRAYRILMGSPRAGETTEFSKRSNLPDKPSIAVLPFDNMSGDPRQDCFADGITEDIITALSRFPHLIVIARNSTFTYKGKPVKVQDVGRELGAQYVVEGSVRKEGDRVRVVAQLIDARTGNHLWADHYDRKFTDIFDLQGEVSQTIVATLPGRLEAAHAERLQRNAPGDMAAHDYLLAAKLHYHRDTKHDNEEALRLLDKAIDLDPESGQSYAWKACALVQASTRGYTSDPEATFAHARETMAKTLSLGENDVECHRILCEINMALHEWDAAEFHHQTAFALNPNDPGIVAQRGELFTRLGRPTEGAEWVRKAMQLDPYGAHKYVHLLGRALYSAKRYAEALHVFKQMLAPDYGHNADLAACYAQMQMDAQAKGHASEVLQLKPDFSIDTYMRRLTYRETTDRERYLDGLRKAGLPE